ncbi:hypothetical protein M0802_001496 [Mischocyttarus mexicanus]|nr:hypothetical protein M0802_001496 [Mischocyttarus mexicanus]
MSMVVEGYGMATAMLVHGRSYIHRCGNPSPLEVAGLFPWQPGPHGLAPQEGVQYLIHPLIGSTDVAAASAGAGAAVRQGHRQKQKERKIGKCAESTEYFEKYANEARH